MKFLQKKFVNLIKRLTIIDYLIIVFVLFSLALIARYLTPEEKWINVLIASQNSPVFQLSSLRIDDYEKGPSGEKTAIIKEIETHDSLLNINTPSADNKDIFLKTKILVKVNPRSGEYEYKNKILKVGGPIEMRFNKSQITGKVVDFFEQEEAKTTETKIITLKIYNQWPWYANSLNIGDSEITNGGKKATEIIAKDVKPAEIIATQPSGESIITTDPRKNDITLKVKIDITKTGKQMIFRQDQSIFIGGLFSFSTNSTKVKEALVSDIE